MTIVVPVADKNKNELIYKLETDKKCLFKKIIAQL